MRRASSPIVLAAALASASANAATYECTLGNAQVVSQTDDSLSGSTITFGDGVPQAWSFRLMTSERNTEIVWSNSPIQLNGVTPRIQTGPTSFASFHVGRGPCLFTEGHCGAVVHYSELHDGSLSILIQPIALTRIENEDRIPFLVHLPGTCVPEAIQ